MGPDAEKNPVVGTGSALAARAELAALREKLRASEAGLREARAAAARAAEESPDGSAALIGQLRDELEARGSGCMAEPRPT